MRSKVNRISIISTIALLFIFLFFIVLVNSSVDFDELNDLTFEMPDLTNVDDGTYYGTYEMYPMSVDIHLVINDHQITDVIMISHSLFFEEEALNIKNQIINTESFQVDFDENHLYSEKILILAIINAIETKAFINE